MRLLYKKTLSAVYHRLAKFIQAFSSEFKAENFLISCTNHVQDRKLKSLFKT